MKKTRELDRIYVNFICKYIGTDTIRNIFKANGETFSKIKSGFRPSELSDEDVKKTMLENIETPFISKILQDMIVKISTQNDKKNEALEEYKEVQAKLKQTEEKNLRFEKENKELQIKYQQMEVKKAASEKKLNSKLEQYDDYINLDSLEEYEGTISVVHQLSLQGQNRFAKRIFDIKNRELIYFHPDINSDSTYSNREVLRLYKDIAARDSEEYFTIRWMTEPNREDPSKDYIRSYDMADIIPVEIICIDNCKNIEDVIRNFNDGIKIENTSSRTAITYSTTLPNADAVLLTKKKFANNGDLWKVREDVFTLPIYKIKKSNYLYSEDRKKVFYTKLSLGMPEEVKTIYTPEITAKKLLLNQLTKKQVQEKGLKNTEWQKCKEIIKEVGKKTLASKLMNIYDCEAAEAYEYIENVINAADEYISKDEVDGNLVANFILNHSELREKYMNEIEEVWKQKNANCLEDAEKKILEKQEELKKLTEKGNNIKGEIEEWHNQIHTKEEQTKKIEENIHKRLIEIKKDASQFISDYILMHPEGKTEEPVPVTSTIEKASESIIILPSINEANMEFTDAYDDFLSLLDDFEENLMEAGVSKKYCIGLTTYLYACQKESRCIVLAGSNGEEIAIASSIAINGKIPHIANLPHQYSESAIQELRKHSESVLIIRNAFSSDWIGHVDQILDIRNKYFIFLLPYYDDLCILPQGLLSYVAPVITDLYVSSSAKGKYCIAEKNAIFKDMPETEKSESSRGSVLSTLSISPLMKYQYEKLLTTSHLARQEWDTSDSDYTDDDFLSVVVPHIYMHGTILDLFTAENDLLKNISKECKKLVIDVLGIKINA